MKNTIYTLLTTLSLIVLTACSGGSSPVSTVPSPTNEDLLPQDTLVEVSNLKIGEFQTLPNTLDFGQVGATTKQVKLKLHNDLTVTENLNLSFSSGNGYTLVLNRCPVALVPNQKCELTFAFSGRGLYNGIHNSGIDINSNIIGMVAEVIGRPDPELTGTPDLKLSFKNSNFSDLSAPVKTMIIKNEGTGVAKNMLISVPTGYRVMLNRCSDKLFPNDECSVMIIWADHRTSNASDASILVSHDNSDATSFVYRSLGTVTGSPSTPVVSFNPVWTTPINTKTAICSGTETVNQSLIRCEDNFGKTVSNLNCPMAPPTVVFNSPEGEFGVPDAITGGSLFKKCLSGSTTLVNSRVECNEPQYLPSGFTCAIQTFEASYQPIPANIVPNICDGTQTYSRSLISGSCHNSSTMATVADSFCPPSISGQHVSPAGSINEIIDDGFRTYSCAEGVASANKVFVSGTCTTANFEYGPSSASGICAPRSFPSGALGHLVVSGTQTLSAGVYDYESITINPSGVLNISGSGMIVLGSKGDVVINGTIVSQRYDQGCADYNQTAVEPLYNPQSYSWSFVQAYGGAGGNGGSSNVSTGGSGGNGSCGHGGGGGGGAPDNGWSPNIGGNGGSGGNPGQAYSAISGRNGGIVSITVTNGSAGGSTSMYGRGGNGGNGGGAGGANGAGGGGGGYKGLHAHSLVIKTKGSVSGSGSINLSGGNGSSGGSGSINGKGYARNGGGGGGAAGGNGGNFQLLYKGSNSFSLASVNVNGGGRGSGGSHDSASFLLFAGTNIPGSAGGLGTVGNTGSKTATTW